MHPKKRGGSVYGHSETTQAAALTHCPVRAWDCQWGRQWDEEPELQRRAGARASQP